MRRAVIIAPISGAPNALQRSNIASLPNCSRRPVHRRPTQRSLPWRAFESQASVTPTAQALRDTKEFRDEKTWLAVQRRGAHRETMDRNPGSRKSCSVEVLRVTAGFARRLVALDLRAALRFTLWLYGRGFAQARRCVLLRRLADAARRAPSGHASTPRRAALRRAVASCAGDRSYRGVHASSTERHELARRAHAAVVCAYLFVLIAVFPLCARRARRRSPHWITVRNAGAACARYSSSFPAC